MVLSDFVYICPKVATVALRQITAACVQIVRCSLFLFYVLLTMYPCIISQINPTRCAILFNIFIYFSCVHVSGVHAPIIRIKITVSMRHWHLSLCMGGVWSAGWIDAPIITRKLLYLCDTGTCHSVWVASGLLLGFHSNQQTRCHPYRATTASAA